MKSADLGQYVYLLVAEVPSFPTSLAVIPAFYAPHINLFQQDLHFFVTENSWFLLDFNST